MVSYLFRFVRSDGVPERFARFKSSSSLPMLMDKMTAMMNSPALVVLRDEPIKVYTQASIKGTELTCFAAGLEPGAWVTVMSTNMLVGRAVRKLFNDTWFWGEIISIDEVDDKLLGTTQTVARILYEDNDTEDLDMVEVFNVLTRFDGDSCQVAEEAQHPPAS